MFAPAAVDAASEYPSEHRAAVGGVRFLGGLPIGGFESSHAQGPGQGVPVISAVMEARIYSPELPAGQTTLFADSELRTGSIAAAETPRQVRKSDGAFGSVRIPIGKFPAAERWRRVHATLAKCKPGKACDKAEALLGVVVDNAAPKRFLAKLTMVNRNINDAIRYVPDGENYGKRDYWAEVAEIAARRRGDCEDFAILKMAALLRLGVPEKSMSIVVLFDHTNKAFHAVLAVATDQGTFILDNNRQEVFLDLAEPTYQPLYSLGAGKAWLHGNRVNAVSAFNGLSNFDAIAPGEGVVN
jgi:predicted transglutaminase-like cysteine proteinase